MPPDDAPLPKPGQNPRPHRALLRVHCHSFRFFPIWDAVVLGRSAPVAVKTLAEALRLLRPEPFVAMPLRDKTIRAIFVRREILRKLTPEAVRKMVMRRIKPWMAESEMATFLLQFEFNLRATFTAEKNLP